MLRVECIGGGEGRFKFVYAKLESLFGKAVSTCSIKNSFIHIFFKRRMAKLYINVHIEVEIKARNQLYEGLPLL